MRFEIETITNIPGSPAGLVIEFPASVSVDLPCQVFELDNPNSTSYTQVLNCAVVNTGTFDVLILPGPRVAGKYAFYAKVTNAQNVMFNSAVPGSVTCTLTFCFTFKSLMDISNRSTLSGFIDNQLFAAGYSIVRASPFGGFAPLISPEIIEFVGSNNRPSSRNNFVLLFGKVADGGGDPSTASPQIFVRAPPGFIFDVDCSWTVKIKPTEIFSNTYPWPSIYAQFPSSMAVTACIGNKNEATITFNNPIPTETTKPYAIRLGVKSNPEKRLMDKDSKVQPSILVWPGI
jgi:hypothetical protein